jgi:hypothetical protein
MRVTATGVVDRESNNEVEKITSMQEVPKQKIKYEKKLSKKNAKKVI